MELLMIGVLNHSMALMADEVLWGTEADGLEGRLHM